MTSPYITASAASKRTERDVRNARLGISTHAEYRRRDYFAHRTQREAGLEYVPWGERLKPLRPWASDVLAAVGLVAFCIAAFVLSSAAADWLR